MRKIVSTLFALSGLLSMPSAHALNTAASFDLSWAYTNLTIEPTNPNTGEAFTSRTLTSPTGIQIDYNVALFDYKTVATVSFLQFQSSNLGSRPISRVGLGASYHFVYLNGQRTVMDNGVEGKRWGISPAVELTAGLNFLSINDPSDPNFRFSASLIDVIPRFLLEIPASPSFLIMLRAGYMTTLGSGAGDSRYLIKYHGMIFNVGFKLTTL